MGKKVKKRGSSKSENMPEGLGLLWNYNGVVSLLFLFLIFATDSALFFGFFVDGLLADLLHLGYFILTISIIFGLTYKKVWTYKLMIYFYSLWIANIIVSVFGLWFLQNNLIKSFYLAISPLLVFFAFLNLSILWYVYEKKEYFQTLKGKTDLIDMVFKRLIFVFYFAFMLFLIFVIFQRIQFFDAYAAIDNLNFHDESEMANFCESIDDTRFQDACIMYLIDNSGHDVSCDFIKTDLYRYDCFRAG